MPYLLRLNASNGEIGIHQGFIASRPSSHGCIRLPRDKAPVFFEATPIDSLVLIE
jgi:lipoprotein-anchoring transpeptidase ErfK/SrfK